MSENWKKELRKIKKMTKKKVLEIRKREELLRDKYKEDAKRIMDLIYSQLKVVEEIFKEKGLLPKIRRYENSIEMCCPFVVYGELRFLPSISFHLLLTNEGYNVMVSYLMGGGGAVELLRSIFGYEKIVIPSPVRIEDIQKEIKAFLQKRSQAIVHMDALYKTS